MFSAEQKLRQYEGDLNLSVLVVCDAMCKKVLFEVYMFVCEYGYSNKKGKQWKDIEV